MIDIWGIKTLYYKVIKGNYDSSIICGRPTVWLVYTYNRDKCIWYFVLLVGQCLLNNAVPIGGWEPEIHNMCCLSELINHLNNFLEGNY